MTGLDTPGGGYNGAYGINNRGQVAGFIQTGPYQFHAALWTTAPPSPDEQIEALREHIARLVAAGVLNEGQGNALLSKLENALKQLDIAHPQPVCNLLSAFRNQVKALLYARVLPVEEAQLLIDAVEAIQSQICR